MRPLRRDLQIIYQDPYESLDPRFPVRRTVEEPLLIHGVGASKEERGKLVRDALVRAGLTPPDLYLDRVRARALWRPAPAGGDRRGAGARAQAAGRR